MNNKIVVAILVVAVVVAGLILWQFRSNSAGNTPLAEEFTWSFIDRGVEASTSIPKTDVALRIAGIDVPLGTYDGNCFAVAGSRWPLLSNELSGAICYWTNGGKEVGVFEEGGKLVLKGGEVGKGADQSPGTRSNFQALTKQPQF